MATYRRNIDSKNLRKKIKQDWDNFVERSKNGTFLHKIDYMHYHLDRFNDCSLILRNHKNEIVALIPGKY